jgi:hypothetical protein
MRRRKVGDRHQRVSGKTTLACRASARRLRVPHIELDAIHHGPDSGRALTSAVFGAERAAVVAGDGCVVDGGYQRASSAPWFPRRPTR